MERIRWWLGIRVGFLQLIGQFSLANQRERDHSACPGTHQRLGVPQWSLTISEDNCEWRADPPASKVGIANELSCCAHQLPCHSTSVSWWTERTKGGEEEEKGEEEKEKKKEKKKKEKKQKEKKEKKPMKSSFFLPFILPSFILPSFFHSLSAWSKEICWKKKWTTLEM